MIFCPFLDFYPFAELDILVRAEPYFQSEEIVLLKWEMSFESFITSDPAVDKFAVALLFYFTLRVSYLLLFLIRKQFSLVFFDF
jgi:hypothetical protein